MRFLIILLSASFIGLSVAASQWGGGLQNNDFQSEVSVNVADLKIFPNPVTGNKFTVTARKNIVSVQLNNMVGQNTAIETIAKSADSYQVVLKERKKGVYLLTVNFSDNTKDVKRIVIN